MTFRWMHSLTLVLAALSFSAQTPPALQTAEPEIPEAEKSDKGRDTYLGRPVARTMHWSGAEWLLRETREDEENSDKLFKELQLESGQTVCDLGCGNGFYTLPMAKAVGPGGRVLAVDIQEEMLTLLKARVAEAGFKNVETLLATARDPQLPPNSCDVVLMVDVYHEISHPQSVLTHVRRALKEDGVLILLEYRLEDPEVPIKLKHKMSKAQIILEMHHNGLQFAREFDGLPWQHLMAFEKDPEFPRETGQQAAAGEAVARGLERALRAGDWQSLRGYSMDQVELRNESPLLANGMLVEHLSRREWIRRLERHVDEITVEAWKASMAKMPLRIAFPTEEDPTDRSPGSLRLISTDPGAPRGWHLRVNMAGQWLVESEAGHF